MTQIPIYYRSRAKRLAIMFLEENKVPARFRPGAKENSKARLGSNIEVEFQNTVESWENVIFQMIESKMENDVLERLLYLRLDETDPFLSVIENKDFNQQMDYLIYRRDECDCPDDELGKLVRLMGAYQRMIEKKIKKLKGLKNILAQELLENGSIEVDGHVIKLWIGHTRDSVSIQADWNKVQSLGDMNKGKDGDRECVAFSGMFQIPRKEVYQYAGDLGFRVQAGVNRKTNLFVFGSENVSPTKMADLIERRRAGQIIEIMDENSFLEMVLANQDL